MADTHPVDAGAGFDDPHLARVQGVTGGERSLHAVAIPTAERIPEFEIRREVQPAYPGLNAPGSSVVHHDEPSKAKTTRWAML